MKYGTFEYSKGNLKIGTDTIIFNMGSATNCPSKLAGLCDINCYAMKAENMYPLCMPYRDRQEAYWLSHSADEIAMDLCGALHRHRRTVRFVRINESGDLHSSECLTKLIKIAKIVRDMFPKVVMYTYTHRSDIVNSKTADRLKSHKVSKNLVINCSNFQRKGLNTFQAIPDIRVHSMAQISKVKDKILNFGVDFACMGDCSVCGYCKKSHGKKIGVPLH